MLGPSNNTQTGYGLLKLTQGDLTMTATGTGMLNSKLAKSRRSWGMVDTLHHATDVYLTVLHAWARKNWTVLYFRTYVNVERSPQHAGTHC